MPFLTPTNVRYTAILWTQQVDFFSLQKSTVMSNKFKSNWYDYGLFGQVQGKRDNMNHIHMLITTVCNYIDQWHQ